MTRSPRGLGLSLLIHGLTLAAAVGLGTSSPIPEPTPTTLEFFVLPEEEVPLPVITEDPPTTRSPDEAALSSLIPQESPRASPPDRKAAGTTQPKKQRYPSPAPPGVPLPSAGEKESAPGPQGPEPARPAEVGLTHMVRSDMAFQSGPESVQTIPGVPSGDGRSSGPAGADTHGGVTGGSSPGTDSGHSDLARQYLVMVRDSIESHKYYPITARRRQLEGRVGIRFVINLEGEVHNVEISSSSGHEALDKAAQKAVISASPFARPPDQAFIDEIPLALTIVFALT